MNHRQTIGFIGLVISAVVLVMAACQPLLMPPGQMVLNPSATQDEGDGFVDGLEKAATPVNTPVLNLPSPTAMPGAASTEIPGPVGVEFRQVIERIRIGKSMEAALQESADTMGTPEFQFFCITLAIQRETGGNLAETLANLSEVLRKRAQMKLKIKAMSSEAKASAWIVGALPFIVFGLIYFMNPDYLAGFFSNPTLMITGIGGLVWMGIGVFIMSRMVNFEI